MLLMILKMSAITTLYILLTMLIWKRTNGKVLTLSAKICIGLIYGLCAVLSTHFGVDYKHMMLNVRDMGPLSAGLFFDPLSGIIAGLIGGIERYIAGTWWGVGSYTRIACSVSTCLAGFLSAFLNVYIFKGKKPSEVYAFFMGAVMEVFHMYVVFITHRDDMSMAFYVVKTCAPGMIFFTGTGMAISSAVLMACSGEWRNPFHRPKAEEVSVTQKFRFWLFAVTFVILAINFLFSFSVQTNSALQNSEDTLAVVSGDIRETYQRVRQTEENTEYLAEDLASIDATALSETIKDIGGISKVDEEFLERYRNIYGLLAITVVGQDGNPIASAGKSPLYTALLAPIMDGTQENMSFSPSNTRSVAGARCEDGMVQVVIAKDSLSTALDLSALSEALSFFHVGNEGSFDLINKSGISTAGDHKGYVLLDSVLKKLKETEDGAFFESALFNQEALARKETLDDGMMLLVLMPKSEIYASRDAQALETALADIMLFAIIYVLISLLVQHIVVDNLDLVNESLGRITDGNLNEVVSVRNSSEFASLSADINQTVDVLKGYIAAAEKRIEQELEFARTIQDSALPKNFHFPRKNFELYASMDPAKEVGGDFYDFFLVGDNKLALVIADVSGKGIPAALFMMRAKTALRGFTESGLPPAEIFYRTNNTLCEGNDAEMFVTVWLGIIDLGSGLMNCANAGHEFPVLMRAGGEFELYKDKHRIALAAMADMPFAEYELQLNPGDRLFVYTDGVPEAINPKEEQYGTDRLVQVLNRVRDLPMEEILPVVRRDIADFADGADQFDDITMLGFTFVEEPKTE